MLEPSKDESHYSQEHYLSIADVSQCDYCNNCIVQICEKIAVMCVMPSCTVGIW